jgi:hypothetical protein
VNIQIKKLENNLALAAFAVIFLGATILFTIGYNFSLPILPKDEGLLLGYTLDQSGLVDLAGYPPIILMALDTVATFTEWRTGEDAMRHTGEIIAVMRLLSALLNLTSLVFIYLTASKLGNHISGLFAAFAWMILPLVFVQMRMALTESWQIAFISSSSYFMVYGLETKKSYWVIVSTILGLLAVVAKYNTLPVLGLGCGASLYLAWQGNRAWWKTLAVQMLMISLVAYLLLFVYGALDYFKVDSADGATMGEAETFLSSGLARMLDFNFVAGLFRDAFGVLGLQASYAPPIIVLGSIFFLRKANGSRAIAYLGILAFAILASWFVASYLARPVVRDRYLSSASSAWIIVLAVSSLALLQAIPHVKYRNLIQLVLGAGFCFIWFFPNIQMRLSLVQQYLRTDTRVGLSEWSQQSLPSGTIALDGEHWYIYDPLWGGYQGHLRPWVAIERWVNRPLSEWQAADIRYVQLSGEYPGTDPTLPFDNILHLKSFPVHNQEAVWTGYSLHIYRIMEENLIETNIVFENGIELHAYELNRTELLAGESLEWQGYWTAQQSPELDYQAFLHLVPMDSFEVLAQLDQSPTLSGRPSSTWDDSAETLVGNPFIMTIPANISSGNYRLIVGLYKLDSFERLRTEAGLDYFEIGTITIR